MSKTDRRMLLGLTASGLLLGTALLAGPSAASDGDVTELTQTNCQFVEPENGVERGYDSQSKADCEAINAQSGEERVAEAKVIHLKPGPHTFRVTNRDVPYDLGFWLRGEGLVARATLPSVSGGGLTPGATKDYVIDLKPGEYVYSCPLNTTPDYKLVVDES